jgi:AhpC/TSA family
MRRVVGGAFVLVLSSPALWALDDTRDPKKPDTPSTAEGKSPAEQYRMIANEAEKEDREFWQAYQKASPEERKKLQRPSPAWKYAARMLELAEKHPKDPAAVDALVWAVHHWGSSPAGQKALDLLVRDHLDSKQLGSICYAFRYAPSGGEQTLRSILQRSPHPEVQAQACFTLALYLKDKARRSMASTAEAEKLFERVAKEYPNVELYPGRTLAAQAKVELFELQRLAIGKVVPEIEGEDADGKHFRLSDYRGKVVLLSFWGNW